MQTFKTRTSDKRTICAISFENETDMKAATDKLIEQFKIDGKAHTIQAWSYMRDIEGDNLDKAKYYGNDVKKYDDAANLLEYGYKKELQTVKASYDGANAAAPCVVKSLHYCGAVPSVGDYLAGRPRDMRRTTTMASDKILTLYVDTAIHCNVKAAEAIEAAAKIAGYIGGLEKAGYRINLHAVHIGQQDRNKISFLDLKLKDARNRANVARFMFPLCHPSFLRVFGLVHLSTNPIIENLGSGHGRPISYTLKWKETIKAVLPEGAQVVSLQELIDGKNIIDQVKEWKAAKPERIEKGQHFRP